jgi:endonuclease YncB( thermonuclease family)
MQILLIVVSLTAAFFQTPPPRRGVTRAESVLVRYVFDGDTIDVSTIGRVRLLGIDAPEAGRGLETPAPFAREARARLTALVLNRWVRLEYEGAPTDKYNRRLGSVFTEDGQFVNAVLVRAAHSAARAAARAGRRAGVSPRHVGAPALGRVAGLYSPCRPSFIRHAAGPSRPACSGQLYPTRQADS